MRWRLRPVLAMGVVVICFSLVAAIFVSVMVEMYVGLLAGMIMLGLGGSSFTKDFAVRYLVYAFGVGMKTDGLGDDRKDWIRGPDGSCECANRLLGPVRHDLGGRRHFSVVFIIAMYVPSIIQGVVQGGIRFSGMEAIRHGGQAASFATGQGSSRPVQPGPGFAAAQSARAAGSSGAGAMLRGFGAGIGSAGKAAGSAAKEKAIVLLVLMQDQSSGCANAKLDHSRIGQSGPKPPPERKD